MGVEHREIAGEKHRQLGYADLVRVVIGDPLPATYDVVGEVTDHASGQRRQAFEAFGVQRRDGVAQGRGGVAVLRQAHRRLAQPRGLPADLGERLGEHVRWATEGLADELSASR